MPSHEKTAAYNEQKLVKEGYVALKTGDPAPDFTTQDSKGQPFSLKAASAQGYVLLFFYPVNNTPNSARHLAALNKATAKLAENKIQAYAVNPGPREEGAAFLKQYGVQLRLLDDQSHKAAQLYGCAPAGSSLGQLALGDVMPQRTVVVVDPQGKVALYYRGFPAGQDAAAVILHELGLQGGAGQNGAAPSGSTPPESPAATPGGPGGQQGSPQQSGTATGG